MICRFVGNFLLSPICMWMLASNGNEHILKTKFGSHD